MLLCLVCYGVLMGFGEFVDEEGVDGCCVGGVAEHCVRSRLTPHLPGSRRNLSLAAMPRSLSVLSPSFVVHPALTLIGPLASHPSPFSTATT